MRYTCYEVVIGLISCLMLISAADPGPVNAATLQLSWSDNSDNEDGFNIERKQGTGGTYSLVATAGPNAISYSDGNLADNTTYCYRVNAFNSAGNSGYANETCATTSGSATTPLLSTSPAPGSSTVTAALLGQTGEDIVGTTSLGPDGIQDVHIRLSGVPNTITGVRITDDGSGIWQTPFNGENWIVAVVPQSDPSIVDLFLDFWQPSSSFTVSLTFADGSSQTLQGSAQAADAVQASKTVTTLTASSLTASSNSTTVQSTLAISKIGLFRADIGEWLLDLNGNGQGDGCSVDSCIRSFGQPGDLPVTRKTNNQTLIGVFRQGLWMFDSNGNNILEDCSVDECDSFGTLGDLPVTGDWDGSGNQFIGVFRPATGEWFLDMNGNGQWDGYDIDRYFGFGADGDLPVIGDWSGTGQGRIGVFRPSTGEWFLDLNGNGQLDGCDVDKCFGPFGVDGDLPVTGDWNGTGQVRIGVYRPSTGDWLLDINGNGQFDGCSVDACLGPLGEPGGLPVTGQW